MLAPCFASQAGAERGQEDLEGSAPTGAFAPGRPRGAPPPALPVAGEPSGAATPLTAPDTVREPAVAEPPAPPRRQAPASTHEPVQAHRFAALERVSIAGTTYYPYSFDGHVHSDHSPDADHPPLDLLAGAERVGLNALIITDHGSAASQLSFRKYKGPVTALIGQEIGGPFGHAVWWNVNAALPSNPSRATLAERAAYAHERGGLIVLCHPGWWIGGREEDPMKWITPEALRDGGLSGDIDALELWNGVYDAPLPKLIAAWVEALEAGVFVPIVGNSDFHRFRAHRLGGPRTVALCDAPEPARCLWSAIKGGRSYVTDGPSLSLEVSGKTLGETLQVPAGAPLDVSVEATAPRGGELRLYLGRNVVQRWPLAAGQANQLRWSGTAPASPSYLRVEIARSVSGREQPVMELLSNPVRLDTTR